MAPSRQSSAKESSSRPTINSLSKKKGWWSRLKGGVAKKFGYRTGSSHPSSAYSSNSFQTTTDGESETADDVEDGTSKAVIKIADVQMQPTIVAGPTAVEISPGSQEAKAALAPASKFPLAVLAPAAPARPKANPAHASQQKQQLHLHTHMSPGPTKQEAQKYGLISGLLGGAAVAAAIGAMWTGYHWFTKRKERKKTEMAYRRIYGEDNEHVRAHW